MKKIKNLAFFILMCMCSIILVACVGTVSKQKSLSKSGLSLLDKGEFEKASIKFDEALTLGENNKKLYSHILAHKALADFGMGDYSKTIEDLGKINDLEDKYKSLLVIALSRQGTDLKSAYDKLLELTNKKSQNEVYNKAVDEFLRAVMSAKSLNNEFEDIDMTSIKILNEKEYLKKKTANNTNNMGIFEYVEGNYDKALEYFNEAMDITKTKDDIELKKSILFNKAACYEYKLEPNEAIKLFEEYIDTYGEDEKVKHELIFLKSRVKNN